MDHAETDFADGAQVPQPLPIQVVFCPGPGLVDLVNVQVDLGSTVLDAVLASGLVQRHAMVVSELRLGVWGRPREPQSRLRERDRVEIYRPLTVDPKEARRLRYRKHRQAKPAAVSAGSTTV